MSDIFTRIVAIAFWFKGYPYKVQSKVFDAESQSRCSGNDRICVVQPQLSVDYVQTGFFTYLSYLYSLIVSKLLKFSALSLSISEATFDITAFPNNSPDSFLVVNERMRV